MPTLNAEALARATLDDKYDLSQHTAFLSGAEAVVRLLITQRARDHARGLNTRGYMTGYRGSPLGRLDLLMQRQRSLWSAQGIEFRPGLNEDLAATALWGSQQAELRGEGKYDGVFGLWYGKSPGVDRSGDVFRHANLSGTSKHGGVLALAGDDHIAESSTARCQSDFAFISAHMPFLFPAGVQDILDYGIHAWAMSRWSGNWLGFKCVKDAVEASAVVDADPERVQIILPDDFHMPQGGLNIRRIDGIPEQEERQLGPKREAALAYARANNLDQTVIGRDGAQAKLAVVASGKGYLDVREALDMLGLNEQRAADAGLMLRKIAMPWPLETDGVKTFAQNAERIFVVEEKRSLVEGQVKEALFGRGDVIVEGKRDAEGKDLIPAVGAVDTIRLAHSIALRLGMTDAAESVARRRDEKRPETPAVRTPYFCSGCPHNSSTKVPEGARAGAGIGCHYMAMWMGRNTEGFTHMGGEGANWIGESPFSNREHVFQNLGDGTYYHSGVLAVRAAVASGVNITYKILYNDAVAMTGGQMHDGPMTPMSIARQMVAEGAARVEVVSDEPHKYPSGAFPKNVKISGRDYLTSVQKRLQETPGVSVMVYDQTCAAEKRRRRKRGLAPDPAKRAVINDLVCEGCGDCGETSNCVSIAPLETEFGRKRTIDQSSCNKDFSCVKGFCPSFVTVVGGRLRRPDLAGAAAPPDETSLPTPNLPACDEPYSILAAGTGGTGVITIGALIGQAAYLEGRSAALMDVTGLAQKGGAVLCHVRVADHGVPIHTPRSPRGGADLLLASDLVVSASPDALTSMGGSQSSSRAVVNAHEAHTSAFTKDPDFTLPARRLRDAVTSTAGGGAEFIDATSIAESLLGNSMAANVLLIGYAWQKGSIPVGRDALLRALELNGASVDMNKSAFAWGRFAAHDPDAAMLAVQKARDAQAQAQISKDVAAAGTASRFVPSDDPDEIVARRSDFLAEYQSASYAARYRAAVDDAREADKRVGAKGAYALEVSKSLFKLMAMKDEYEVARLHTQSGFLQDLARRFEGKRKLKFHMAPPLLARMGDDGRPRKMEFSAWWAIPALRTLARMRRLRGGFFDIFRFSSERKRDRAALARYEDVIAEINSSLLSKKTLKDVVAFAALPQRVRGFGHVRGKSMDAAEVEESRLIDAIRGGAPAQIAEKAALSTRPFRRRPTSGGLVGGV